MAARSDRPYRSQFSTRRSSIRKNSRSLSVTTVRSNASAGATMSKSFAPIGWPICSEPALITPYMASTGAASKIHRLCRTIVDRWKILIERLERCKDCQERSGRRRLDNEPLSFFPDDCVLSRQLEFARNSYGLTPPILEKFDVPLTHRHLIAYALAYKMVCM